MTKYIALVLFVLACNEAKKKPPPEPAVHPRSEPCTLALGRFEQFVNTGGSNETLESRKTVKLAVFDRCLHDHWSEAAITCMRAATTSHDTFKCWTDHLTNDQRDAAKRALGALNQ